MNYLYSARPQRREGESAHSVGPQRESESARLRSRREGSRRPRDDVAAKEVHVRTDHSGVNESEPQRTPIPSTFERCDEAGTRDPSPICHSHSTAPPVRVHAEPTLHPYSTGCLNAAAGTL